MINRVSSVFSIKDLENLSGIKIPTIRMWEKRYNLLQPTRSTTNIRSYNTQALQKLLNVSFLKKHGHKISKLAQLNEQELAAKCKEVFLQQQDTDPIINQLLISTLNYDKTLFYSTYSKLSESHSFSEIFTSYIGPFLERMGMLWQTGSINPMQEHFISNLILQKIHSNIDKVSSNYSSKNDNDETFYILFLAENEIHELGLLFIYYKLILNNQACIYLGQNTSIEQLKQVSSLHPKITFISNFTVAPNVSVLDQYFDEFEEEILKNQHFLKVYGYQVQQYEKTEKRKNIRLVKKAEELY